MLYSLVTNNTNTQLTLMLIERSITFSWYPYKVAVRKLVVNHSRIDQSTFLN